MLWNNHSTSRLLLSFMLLLLNASLVLPPLSLAKGISVVSQGGQSIYLYKDYHALVVGVSKYDKQPDRPHASDDAREVSRFLKSKGFRVTLVTDPTSLELKKALNDLVYAAGREQDRGIVFYYAGQGETQTRKDGTKLGWIVPSDCPTLQDDPEEFVSLAISMSDIETLSTQIRSRHVLMIFDASFSGAVFSLESPVLEAIGEKSALAVRQYIISGGEGETQPEKNTFKTLLLKGLEGDADLIYDGYITGSELAIYLADRVEKQTGGLLHPQYGKFKHAALARGDFVFHLVETKPERGRLFVETEPEGAQVRILNIGPRFIQGMELLPGKYHVEVSAEGYKTAKEWIALDAGEDRTLEMSLEKVEILKKDEVEVTNILGMKFVPISSGSFQMGSSGNEDYGSGDEKNHNVTLTEGFYLQTTEVTVGQFRKFVDATGYTTEGEKSGGCWVSSAKGRWRKNRESSWKKPGSWETDGARQTDSHPVTCVSWNDAQAFAAWLSEKEGKNYTLPTEAEWEYACRAGTSSPFAFGRCLSTDQANYGSIGPSFSDCKDSYRENRKRPLAVSSLSPNPWGLFDMHGNVSEWVGDWYGPYPPAKVTDPKGPSSGTERVMRGGHWQSDANGCRSAKRSSFPPGGASDAIGFRLVKIP
jgi:formylglycine-generating enzyme required for sulfatase activity